MKVPIFLAFGQFLNGGGGINKKYFQSTLSKKKCTIVNALSDRMSDEHFSRLRVGRFGRMIAFWNRHQKPNVQLTLDFGNFTLGGR